MRGFDTPVGQVMVGPVLFTRADASLAEAHRKLQDHKISSLPVLKDGELVGVISRSDLLRVGRSHASTRDGTPLLTLPERVVADDMTANVVTVAENSPAFAAAELMLKHHVHRVFVTRASKLAGVFGTRDIMALIRDHKAEAPISESMSAPILTVNSTDSIALAAERLDKAYVTTLLVVEDEWPVGVFTQTEALAARELANDTPVDEVMNPALVCVPQDTRIHRAAHQALAMSARCVVAVKHHEAAGILTGLDFARFLARHASQD